jgi:hypothetical protein
MKNLGKEADSQEEERQNRPAAIGKMWQFPFIFSDVVHSVVDPKLFFPDPEPTLTLISDPDSNPDPVCL